MYKLKVLLNDANAVIIGNTTKASPIIAGAAPRMSP